VAASIYFHNGPHAEPAIECRLLHTPFDRVACHRPNVRFSNRQALRVKAQHGDALRRRYSAYAVMIARAASDNYFPKLVVPLGAAKNAPPDIIDGVAIRFEESEPFKSFAT
jgi:hypothetical protein